MEMKYRNVDFNLNDKNGRTPLHFAAANNYLDIVQFILEKGDIKNINPKDVWGLTPYDEAEKGKHYELTEYLLIKGGKPGNSINKNYKDQSIISILTKNQKRQVYQKMKGNEKVSKNDIKTIFFNNSVHQIAKKQKSNVQMQRFDSKQKTKITLNQEDPDETIQLDSDSSSFSQLLQDDLDDKKGEKNGKKSNNGFWKSNNGSFLKSEDKDEKKLNKKSSKELLIKQQSTGIIDMILND